MSTAIRIVQGRFGRLELLSMDTALALHARGQLHLLLPVAGAGGAVDVRGQRYPLAPGQAVLMNAWEPHAYRPPAGQQRQLLLALYAEPGWLAAAGLPPAVRWGRACVALPPGLRVLAERLATLMAQHEGMDEAALQAGLAVLLETLLAHQPLPQGHAGFGVVRRACDARIRKAIDYLRSHVGAELDMDTVAAEACLSRAHFFKLFRQSMHLTPALYVNALRIDAAIAGLGAGGRALRQLSDDLGFNAQSHFSRFFREHCGVSPSQYRQAVERLPACDVAAAQRAPVAHVPAGADWRAAR
ncbi:helix-turn-helix domain-containing protein [Pigmentiphaga soli]|uniref:Helix-turn-helix domain-containing protein n=2 Tax=Pigmentiphaga soli TaxID=1007095 RepID=A0ABP8GE51_9BURK